MRAEFVLIVCAKDIQVSYKSHTGQHTLNTWGEHTVSQPDSNSIFKGALRKFSLILKKKLQINEW